MPNRKTLLPALAALLLLLTGTPAGARSDRAAGLEKAAAADGALRSVFFVRGMSCRACTLILDRHLAQEEGIFWARFNYPLRTFTAYHNPDVVSAEKLAAFVGRSEELDARLMGSRPAAEILKGPSGTVAAWEGGSLPLDEALAAPYRFEQGLKDYMIDEGMAEWHQVAYEIAGEEARNRLFFALAGEKGYDGADEANLPVVVGKDFYWPSDLLKPTPAESAMAAFIREEILGGEEAEGSAGRFDTWFLELYGKVKFDYRGELMELQERNK